MVIRLKKKNELMWLLAINSILFSLCLFKLNHCQTVSNKINATEDTSIQTDNSRRLEDELDEVSDISELPDELKSSLLPNDHELVNNVPSSPTSSMVTTVQPASTASTISQPNANTPEEAKQLASVTSTPVSSTTTSIKDEADKVSTEPTSSTFTPTSTPVSSTTTINDEAEKVSTEPTSSTTTSTSTSTATPTSTESMVVLVDLNNEKVEYVAESSIATSTQMKLEQAPIELTTRVASTTEASASTSIQIMEKTDESELKFDQTTLTTTSTQNEPVLKQPLVESLSTQPTPIETTPTTHANLNVNVTATKQEIVEEKVDESQVEAEKEELVGKEEAKTEEKEKQTLDEQNLTTTPKLDLGLSVDEETEKSHQTVSPIPSNDLNETILNKKKSTENFPTTQSPLLTTTSTETETSTTSISSSTTTMTTMTSSVNEKENESSSQASPLSMLSNNIQSANGKYCADLKPLKSLMSNHVEPIYMPFISILPEDLQLLLLEETQYAGLNIISCLLLAITFFLFMLSWFGLLKHREKQEKQQTKSLNEQLIALNKQIESHKYEKETLEHCLNDLDMKLKLNDSDSNDKDEKLDELNLKYSKLCEQNDELLDDLNKMRQNEMKLNKELNTAKCELNLAKESSVEQKSDFELKLNDYSERIKQLELDLAESVDVNEKMADLEARLREMSEACEQKEKTIHVLQNSLLILKEEANNHSGSGKNVKCNGNSTRMTDSTNIEIDYVNINEDLILNESNSDKSLSNIMKLAELQMEIKNLEESLQETKSSFDLKQTECDQLVEKLSEKEAELNAVRTKIKDNEKLMKENEMQIKLLNELREKDTKQHLKVLTELDSKLKKKSTDADKASHFLDQIRVKQERIQELESQNARIEKQANQERQTYEKQVHENWLQSKKMEKELKEARNETAQLKEKLNELEQQLFKYNKMMQQANPSMMIYNNNMANSRRSANNNETNLSNSHTEETTNNGEQANNESGEPVRPPSTASNASSINQLPFSGAAVPNPFIRMPPMRYVPPPFGVPPPNPYAFLQAQSQQQNSSESVHQPQQQQQSSSSPSPDPAAGANPQLQQQQQQQRLAPVPPPSFAMYGRIPPPHPMALFMQQQQQQQQQLTLNQKLMKSAASSQQPSPAGLFNAFNNSNLNNSLFNDPASMNNSLYSPRSTSHHHLDSSKQHMLNNNQSQLENSASFSQSKQKEKEEDLDGEEEEEEEENNNNKLTKSAIDDFNNHENNNNFNV